MISEILLQRTKANQVKPVYLELIKTYPNIKTISKANINKIENIIKPLGLIKRAKYILEIAQTITKKYNEKIPKNKKNLTQIKGIGEYTANSLLVFGFDENLSIIDSNVIRILNRVYNLNYTNRKPNETIKNLANNLLPNEKVKSYNYGLLDLGSEICKPKKDPECNKCPLNKICLYI